jgi:hypothetical protein
LHGHFGKYLELVAFAFVTFCGGLALFTPFDHISWYSGAWIIAMKSLQLTTNGITN